MDWRNRAALGGLSVLTAGLFAIAIAPASILPLLAAAFDVGKPAASGSISAVFLTWGLLQIPGGLVLDRYDNRRLLLVGALVYLLATLAGLAVGSYRAFLLTRLVLGASVVFVFTGSVNVLNRILPEARRALGLGLFIATPPVGIALAQSTGPLIAVPYSWRAAFLAYVALATVGFLVVLVFLRQPVPAAGAIRVSRLARTVGNRNVVLVSAASLCTYAMWTFLLTWMPAYGTDVLGIDLAAAGAATALVPLAGIVARPSGGWLSDVLGGRVRPIVGVSFAAALLFLLALSRAGTPVTYAVLLALTGAAVNLAVGLYFVSIHRVTDAETRGTGLSVLITFSQVGNLLAPVLGGWVIVAFSWTAAFAVAAGFAVVGLLVTALLPGTVGLASVVESISADE